MRLDRVEIKVSFDRETTSDAVEALGLPSRSEPWQVHFCEDVTVGTPDTPLLDLGVVLRARVRPDGDDDVTVKLRPCQGSQLPARWTEEPTGSWASGLGGGPARAGGVVREEARARLSRRRWASRGAGWCRRRSSADRAASGGAARGPDRAARRGRAAAASFSRTRRAHQVDERNVSSSRTGRATVGSSSPITCGSEDAPCNGSRRTPGAFWGSARHRADSRAKHRMPCCRENAAKAGSALTWTAPQAFPGRSSVGVQANSLDLQRAGLPEALPEQVVAHQAQ